MLKSIRLAALLAAAALAGCSSPKSSFYTLSSDAAPGRAPATAQYSVEIGAVTVPDVVDRPQLVTRSGANQVTINEFARWAEPLKSEIPRVIADNLTQLLDGVRVSVYPQHANPDDYQVLIEVQRFDSALGEAATVEVLWTVKAPKGGASKTGRSVAREAAAGASYDALVAAHSRALASISRDIAAAVRAVRGAQ